jgi:hypothetical protein
MKKIKKEQQKKREEKKKADGKDRYSLEKKCFFCIGTYGKSDHLFTGGFS